MNGNRPDGHAERQAVSSGRLPGWTVLVIADICAAYWLARAGVLSAGLAVILGAVAAVMVLAVRGAVRSRARRRRRGLNARLASDMRAVAARDTGMHDEQRETAAQD